MKRFFIIAGIVVAIAALIVFNKMTSKKGNAEVTFAQVVKGNFEITVTAAGELIAEKSTDIRGPEYGQANTQQQQIIQVVQTGGGQRGAGGGGGATGGGGGGRGGGGMQVTVVQAGSDMRAADLKIQDIVPEGTIVNEGDYIAQLDRTNYDNNLKDARVSLLNMQTAIETKMLDTAVTLSSYRDDITNQKNTVEEANITLAQSQFEPPATIRQAQINLEQAQRSLEQRQRSYRLRVAQALRDINTAKLALQRQKKLVSDLESYLDKFTIKAPSAGMVIYKKERNGAKRKAGSSISTFDNIIATLPDLSSMISKVYVSEIEVSKVKPSQKVNIIVDAFPKKSFAGVVISVANIGEVLPNSDAKMFETQIRLDGSDPSLRPSMTTGNKIIINSINDAVFIPTECVQTGPDSIPFVYKKNRTKQVVVLGESNEKNVLVEQGLESGTSIYLAPPKDPEKFKLTGQNFIPTIKEREKAKRTINEKYRKEG